MNARDEAILRPLVEAFVADQGGRYRNHCSNVFLVEVLMMCLDQAPSYSRPDHDSAAYRIVRKGDGNAAYAVSCRVFERILEHRCQAGGNGHHIAQYFSQALEPALGKLAPTQETDVPIPETIPSPRTGG